MTLEGRIENGMVVFDAPVPLPNGTRVTVSVDSSTALPDSSPQQPTLYDRLKSVVGSAKGLPSDLAMNHDHYLHGQPKRQ
jgi:hypothetical protein